MNSTSVLQSSDATSKISGRVEEQRIGDRGSKKRSSLNRTAEHPIVDITNLEYRAYRHKLVEATLRKRYDDSQPPGDVVLNSLHLNPADSVIGVRLNDRYDHSLFDFVEEYYDVAGAKNRRNVLECPRPIDHFLSKAVRRPRTTEKETETILDKSIEPRALEDDGNHFLKNDNGNFAKSSGTDNNGNPCVPSLPRSISLEANVVPTIARSDLNSKLQVPRRETEIPPRNCVARPGCDVVKDDCWPEFAASGAKKESSWRRDNLERPASAGTVSETSPKGCASAVEKKGVTKSAGRPKTTATGRWRDFKGNNLDDYPARGSSSSGKRRRCADAEKSNLISASSSEIVSVCSDSSGKRRRRDETSRRWRESSISRASSRPPWMSGNLRGISFNRKYGNSNISRDPAKSTRPSTTTSNKESDVSRNPVGRRAASFIASREKEFVGAPSIEQRLTTSPACQRRDKLKDVEGAKRAERNEERKRTWGTPDSTITRDNVAFLSQSRARTSRVRPDVTSAAASLGTARTTKEPRLTSRCGARREPGNTSPDAGRDRRGKEGEGRSAKLNRGGRRRLRSAENPSKGASLSPKIELSAEVLSPADGTDKSAIPDGERPGRVIIRMDPRRDVAEDEAADGAPVPSAKPEDIKSNNVNVNDVARTKVAKIMRNRPTNNNLPDESEKSGVSSRPPGRRMRDANSGTKGGLNGAKLNARSNSAVEMRRDESSKVESEWDLVGKVASDELQLPRRDSKMDLVMNSGLKRYIKMVKQSLQDEDEDNKEDAVSLASLSLSDAILSEPKTSLSLEETRELQNVLNKIERNPELLGKK